MVKKSKLTAKEKKRIRQEVAEMPYKATVKQLDRLVATLARYDFLNTCTGGVYFEEAYNNALKNGYDRIRNSKLSKKKRHELRVKLLGFSERVSKIEYNKQLIKFAENDLNRLPIDRKREIVLDCLQMQDLWTRQFNRNWEIYKALGKKTVKNVLMSKKRAKK